ncbi:MAG: hypothetical protein LBK99_25865 [Opitutaceae bacterium]|jgi:hypothetical protein|nr:hypothetical protein [Opitutaceae bacterium]
MALKKICFTWPTPPLTGSRWRLGLFNIQRANDPARPLPKGGAVPAYWKAYLHHHPILSVRGLLLWGFAFALCTYLVGAGFLLLRLQSANPYNRVGYLDLVLPTRWENRTRLQGEGFILLARERLKAGRFSDGFGLLRLGVGKNPANFTARGELARIYVALRLRPQAEKLLRDGFAFGYPGRDYLEVVFDLAEGSDHPSAWVDLYRLARSTLDALPPAARPAGDARWIDQQTVKALMADSRSAEAIALVAGYPEQDSFRRTTTIVGRLEQGDAPAAVSLARAWTAEQPRSPDAFFLLARVQREACDFAGMDATLVRIKDVSPTRAAALLYALMQNLLAGRTEQSWAVLESLIFRYGADETFYPRIARILVESRLEGGLQRLERELRERGLSPRPVLGSRLQVEIAARDWTAALATTEELRASPGPPFTERETVWLDTMIRLASACSDAGSGVQTALVKAVSAQPGTVRLYQLLIDALADSGRGDTAARILTLANGFFPSSRILAERRARIESMRVPEPVGPAPAAKDDPALASLDALTSEYARRLQDKDTSGALALLVAARRARPVWLSGAERRLDALELPLRARGGDSLRLLVLARATLVSDPGASNALLALAREIYTEGYHDHALLLIKDVLRRAPSHADALAQLAIWEPPAPKPPVDVQP